jgi:hypothetical protein
MEYATFEDVPPGEVVTNGGFWWYLKPGFMPEGVDGFLVTGGCDLTKGWIYEAGLIESTDSGPFYPA